MLSKLRRKRILLLDDDPSMQRLVATLLKRQGYRVDVFLTGLEAISAIATAAYDALLLDLMMPHEGGNTVIRHLRASNAPMLQKVLLVTGSPEAVLAPLAKEVAGVVKKPFEAAELVGAVRRVAGK